MKTAISIPDPLFEAAERLADHLGISRSELYQRAVTLFLEEQGTESVTRALDDLYGAEPNLSRLDPALERLQELSLGEDDW